MLPLPLADPLPQVSDGLYTSMLGGAVACRDLVQEVATTTGSSVAWEEEHLLLSVQEQEHLNTTCKDAAWESYSSLQYSFFSNSGVEMVGGVLFLLSAIWIVKDKMACQTAVSGQAAHHLIVSHLVICIVLHRLLYGWSKIPVAIWCNLVQQTTFLYTILTFVDVL